MRAEIVTTGTELLLGQIDDTNATFLARQLCDLGIDLFHRTTVGDNELRIAETLEKALARADLVITTGGLGPTVDDVTREAVSRATGRPLVFSPELLAQIKVFFDRFGAKMADNNRRQAYLPEGAIPIENPVGTAPVFIVEGDAGTIITLPGVPREMRYLMENTIVPYLRERLGHQDVLLTRILRTVAVGESQIDRTIADLELSTNPTVGLSAHAGQTDVRIVAKAPTQVEAKALIDGFEAQIRDRLGDAIYATGNVKLEEAVAASLSKRNATLAVAETSTQGEVIRRMSAHPDVLSGGIVAADGSGLARLLRLQDANPVGQAGALALAQAACQALDADYGLAVLGRGDEKPWVAIASEQASDTRNFRFRGRDARALIWSTTLTLEFLRRHLLGIADGWGQ
jgi:competence/damage-inducible protein CinA-like protein